MILEILESETFLLTLNQNTQKNRIIPQDYKIQKSYRHPPSFSSIKTTHRIDHSRLFANNHFARSAHRGKDIPRKGGRGRKKKERKKERKEERKKEKIKLDCAKNPFAAASVECESPFASNCPRVLRNTNYANEKGTRWKNARWE